MLSHWILGHCEVSRVTVKTPVELRYEFFGMGSGSGVNCGAISTTDSSTAHRHTCYKLL